MKYEYSISFATEQAWAILPDKLRIISELLQLRAAGLTLSPQEIRARIGTPERREAMTTESAVAVLPLRGVLLHRMNMIEESSGGTSTERFTNSFRQAVNDPEVGAILLDVNSPGGGTVGLEELHREIMAGRAKKKVVAISNGLMASAAYYVASAADEIVSIPSGEVGHIGTIGFHVEESKKNEQNGITVTVLSAGKHKADGNPFEPLTEQAREFLQGRVDKAYDMFVSAVARGRGISVKAVRNGYGEGRLLDAKTALSEDMIDRIATFDETLARLATKRGRAQVRTVALSIPATAFADMAPTTIAGGYEDTTAAQNRPSLEIQTLIFPKSKWNSEDEVKKWAKDHGFRADKVDETESSWRLRQREPSEFQDGTLRTFCVSPSRQTSMADCRVKAVGGRRRGAASSASSLELHGVALSLAGMLAAQEEVEELLVLAESDGADDLPPWADHETENATIATTNFAGSPRSKYGTHASKGFKGGADGYKRAWRLHFSQVGGGKLDGASSGPIRGTVRRVAMIAAGMKPPCDVRESEGIGPRDGGKSPLPGDFPSSPKDYGLSSWAKPSDDGLKREDVQLTCSDLNVIKRAATAEIKWRAREREKKEKGEKKSASAEFQGTVEYRELRRQRLERMSC